MEGERKETEDLSVNGLLSNSGSHICTEMGKNDTESVDKSPQIQTERLNIGVFTTASGREGRHRQLPGTKRARNQSVEVKTDV